MDFTLKTLPPIRLAYLRVTGPYGSARIPHAWQRFAAWCSARALHGVLYGLALDDPMKTTPTSCRYDCCVAVEDDFKPDGEFAAQTFTGGRFVCSRFVGTPNNINKAWVEMFTQLPLNGYHALGRPAVEVYERGSAADPKSGTFSCLLCVPVKLT